MVTLKESIIKDLVKTMGISEDIITKVILFQGEDAIRATKKYQEVEFSGFGKFLLSQNKLKKRIEKTERILGFLKNPSKGERREEVITDMESDLNKLIECLR